MVLIAHAFSSKKFICCLKSSHLLLFHQTNKINPTQISRGSILPMVIQIHKCISRFFHGQSFQNQYMLLWTWQRRYILVLNMPGWWQCRRHKHLVTDLTLKLLLLQCTLFYLLQKPVHISSIDLLMQTCVRLKFKQTQQFA